MQTVGRLGLLEKATTEKLTQCMRGSLIELLYNASYEAVILYSPTSQ